MNLAWILVLAMLLDSAAGEPRWLWQRVPHPAVLMGQVVGWCDRRFNDGSARRLKGIAIMVGLGLGAIGLGMMLHWLGWIVEIFVVAILLAQKSLVDHVRAVANALRLSVGDARVAVAQIVGRDTKAMQRPAIARAAIESAAENFSDGVIAPAFWFLVAGLPGLLFYKITNTADSMIGYRNARYAEYGWAAARLDDALNIIPSRLTALLIAGAHGRLHPWREIADDARLHRSPNAGWPEAAMAQVLDVALAGPRSYDGELREFPFVNEDGQRNAGADQVDAACAALWRSWTGGLTLVLVVAVVMG